MSFQWVFLFLAKLMRTKSAKDACCSWFHLPAGERGSTPATWNLLASGRQLRALGTPRRWLCCQAKVLLKSDCKGPGCMWVDIPCESPCLARVQQMGGWQISTNLCGKSTETVDSCNGNSRPQVLSVLAPPRRVPYFSPPKRCHPANMCTQCGNSVQTYHSGVHILCDSGSQCVWQRPVVQQKGCLSEILIGHKGTLLTNANCFFQREKAMIDNRLIQLTLRPLELGTIRLGSPPENEMYSIQNGIVHIFFTMYQFFFDGPPMESIK